MSNISDSVPDYIWIDVITKPEDSKRDRNNIFPDSVIYIVIVRTKNHASVVLHLLSGCS